MSLLSKLLRLEVDGSHRMTLWLAAAVISGYGTYIACGEVPCPQGAEPLPDGVEKTSIPRLVLAAIAGV